jgi:hypothetical protein
MANFRLFFGKLQFISIFIFDPTCKKSVTMTLFVHQGTINMNFPADDST